MISVKVVGMRVVALIAVLLALVSDSSGQKSSLFQQAFEEVVPKAPSTDITGAAPANTYPLTITPLNFAPAVVAPPTNIYPSSLLASGKRKQIKGAIPLFKPLKEFPYIKFIPISNNFYLNEPNVRNPFASAFADDFPVKVSAPRPSFLPIQDTQVRRRPSKDRIINEVQTDLDPFHNSKVSPNLMIVSNFEVRNEGDKGEGVQIVDV
ncbi:Protein bric-a-brac 2 [Armadillidium vulgare]|nr:Protein bric-a-brac 2 [Armadillidium vulgare]